jgi:hypothetical protein
VQGGDPAGTSHWSGSSGTPSSTWLVTSSEARSRVNQHGANRVIGELMGREHGRRQPGGRPLRHTTVDMATRMVDAVEARLALAGDVALRHDRTPQIATRCS